MLDFYDVLDIGEGGVAVQCPSPMEINHQVELSLDLSESDEQISATARVVWSDSAGRVGLGFPALTEPVRRRLREWLFLNAIVGGANAASSLTASPLKRELSALDYSNDTDTLGAAAAVQREVESLTDLDAILSLIAVRSHSLLRASGAAIALAGDDVSTITCKASAGQSAPPVGAMLQVGVGFSGECMRTGKTLVCSDTESDDLVDRESCRALGIRSILAVPVRSGEKVIGLIEVFSEQPKTFGENDGAALQRFAATVTGAVNRAAMSNNSSVPVLAAPEPVCSTLRTVWLANEPAIETGQVNPSAANDEEVGRIHATRAHLYVLYCIAAVIALVLAFAFVPSIQARFHARKHGGELTVSAWSRSPAKASVPDPGLNSSEIEQLRALASHGNPAAENAMGLLYSEGDEKHGIMQDQREAVRWFTKAAEHGSVPAQYKLSLLYWSGHGVPKDPNKAYFWAVLARAGGQEGSDDLAKILAKGLVSDEVAAIEQQAKTWYRRHDLRAKPRLGR